MNIRQTIEHNEHLILCERAAFADSTAGRAVYEPPCELRTEYSRDRDRIIHSKAFRRLKQKTQVFLSPEGDHYRTRLTHTLEVAQISRTVARALRLNEDLTEAVALGHDLGHTPFGHAGERAIAGVFPGFTHYMQSVRVVEKLERDHRGLNLCAETVDGIRTHTCGPQAATLEGRIVRVCDKIAYLNHDYEDATTSAGIELTLPENVVSVLGDSKSRRITTLITSLVERGCDDMSFAPEIQAAFDEFHAFMMANLYLSSDAKSEEYKVQGMIEALFYYYANKHPERLPEDYRATAREESPARAAADYISGMSDVFAVNHFEELFIPKSWTLV